MLMILVRDLSSLPSLFRTFIPSSCYLVLSIIIKGEKTTKEGEMEISQFLPEFEASSAMVRFWDLFSVSIPFH